MRATIDGITYEGTPEEIRDIVENPPVLNAGKQHTNCPDNGRLNYPTYPTYPYPYPYPTNPANITRAYYKWNCDKSPAITCCASFGGVEY